ncbi:MAG: MATE family efflux transporter, partial [Paramuribaculum sp.]|nr:MATE family efflux transporter [Paramuribaculum sp.]
FLTLLSSDGEVVARSKEFFGWAVSIPLLGFMAFVGDGIMIGMTRTRVMLASMGIGAAVYFTLYMILFPRIGNHGLWIAFLAYLLSRGIVLQLAIRKI